MSTDPVRWMVYGANGYTGRLVADVALAQGLRPILAGRSEAPVREMAENLGLEWRVFDLNDASATQAAINDCRAVLHCAGPFSVTSQPMIEACLQTGTHYLDITGEISVFANAHRQSDEASRRDVLLIPGVGFDVVPTDCLAARLVQALPSATHLTLAFEAGGGPSPGTAKTAAENMSRGGCVRHDGRLRKVPAGYKARQVPFASGERHAVTIPWGDVYTAYVSTGVPNIEVYMAMPPARLTQMRRMRWLAPLMGLKFVRNMAKKKIEQNVSGPSPEKRASTESQIWGEVVSADGRRATATMTTPNGYDLTATAAVAITRHVLENDVEGGFYTPSLLMGAEFAESLPGVSINLDEAS